MNEKTFRRVGVSLDRQTEKIVKNLNDGLGFYNFSAALRYIINDWAKKEGWDFEPIDDLAISPASSPASDGDDDGDMTILAGQEGA